MFNRFFLELKDAHIPVSIKEYLMLLDALRHRVVAPRVEDFYYLARAALVKDETLIDRFDQVFAKVFDGLEFAHGDGAAALPEEWLKKLAELVLSPEEMAQIKALGSWDDIMDTLKKRLQEQQGRHQGGSKWIGTAGRSPFGAYGYNPEGVRIGQRESRHGRAVKVWDKREYRDLDNSRELGTRSMKMALRRLRRFAREGAADQFDLAGTIRETARKTYLDIQMMPERRNAVKILLLLDVGGSMDSHVRTVEELFSAVHGEFKNLEYFYFHNCIYESLWKNNRRRWRETTATWDVLHTFPHDYKVVLVGDATMSPYEIVQPGGAVEHWNEEPGEVWLRRLRGVYDRLVWINPVPETYWPHTMSIGMIRDLIGGHMYPLTLDGLDRAMRALSS